MIGYYIHHVGRGHLHQALAVAAALDDDVTALSSLPREDGWPGDWVVLPRDDGGDAGQHGPTAGGALHWAPVHHAGLQQRMRILADWVAHTRPRALVVDLSVEITAFARLLGVPVVTWCLPGVRTDPAHRLGWSLSEAIIAPWPENCGEPCVGLAPFRSRVAHVGAISRYDGRAPAAAPDGPRRAVVLGGRGGRGGTNGSQLLPMQVPGWTCTVLDADSWVEDPWPELCAADVVVTHAGLGAIADVAAARRPAVVLPHERPFAEQQHTAAALHASGTAICTPGGPGTEWAALLDQAVAAGGESWRRWSFGDGAHRAAAVVHSVAARFEQRTVSACASR